MARANPGKRKAYFVHDGLVQKSGAGIASNLKAIPIGAGDYTVIYWSPLASHMSRSYALYSGLYVENFLASQQASYPVTLNTVTTNARPYIDTYGGVIGSIGSEGFIWAASMEVQLVGQNLSTSGKVYMGKIKLGSLSSGATMTPDRLI